MANPAYRTYKELAEKVECSSCKVAAGHPCVNLRGEPLRMPHTPRYSTYRLRKKEATRLEKQIRQAETVNATIGEQK